MFFFLLFFPGLQLCCDVSSFCYPDSDVCLSCHGINHVGGSDVVGSASLGCGSPDQPVNASAGYRCRRAGVLVQLSMPTPLATAAAHRGQLDPFGPERQPDCSVLFGGQVRDQAHTVPFRPTGGRRGRRRQQPLQPAPSTDGGSRSGVIPERPHRGSPLVV